MLHRCIYSQCVSDMYFVCQRLFCPVICLTIALLSVSLSLANRRSGLSLSELHLDIVSQTQRYTRDVICVKTCESSFLLVLSANEIALSARAVSQVESRVRDSLSGVYLIELVVDRLREDDLRDAQLISTTVGVVKLLSEPTYASRC
ncbi:hypothetical protein Tco_0786169 [Tanacetum coccineum]